MTAGRLLLSIFFIAAGSLHFFLPGPYFRMMPPMLPWPKLLIDISGAAEILGGLGLLVPGARRAAAYGLMLLLVAVFPANIYMAVAHLPLNGLLGHAWFQWLRLPLQIPLIAWAWVYAKPAKGQ